jgi:ribonuclease HI
MSNYEIWTDGAYKPTTDVGGAAIVVTKDSRVMYKISNRYEKVTNNIMEITAIIMALKFVDHKIDSLIIHTDSQYCLGIINKGWTRNKNQLSGEMFDKTLERQRAL